MRAYEPSDAEAVLAINAECVPEVGTMDTDQLAYFEKSASFFAVVTNEDADSDDEVVGFLIGLDEAVTDYPSPNFTWFAGRHAEFGYVDRIAISEVARGQGFGPALYNAFEAWAYGHGKRVLAAEVNTVPDNPHSHHFHVKFGFTEMERGNPYGSDEEVAYYEKWL